MLRSFSQWITAHKYSSDGSFLRLSTSNDLHLNPFLLWCQSLFLILKSLHPSSLRTLRHQSFFSHFWSSILLWFVRVCAILRLYNRQVCCPCASSYWRTRQNFLWNTRYNYFGNWGPRPAGKAWACATLKMNSKSFELTLQNLGGEEEEKPWRGKFICIRNAGKNKFPTHLSVLFDTSQQLIVWSFIVCEDRSFFGIHPLWEKLSILDPHPKILPLNFLLKHFHLSWLDLPDGVSQERTDTKQEQCRLTLKIQNRF